MKIIIALLISSNIYAQETEQARLARLTQLYQMYQVSNQATMQMINKPTTQLMPTQQQPQVKTYYNEYGIPVGKAVTENGETRYFNNYGEPMGRSK